MIRYWKSLNKLVQLLLIAAAGMTTFSGAAAVASEYRWWVWRGEFIELAADSYKGDIEIKQSKLLSTRLIIARCVTEVKCSERIMINLLEGETLIKQQIEELNEKRNKARE